MKAYYALVTYVYPQARRKHFRSGEAIIGRGEKYACTERARKIFGHTHNLAKHAPCYTLIRATIINFYYEA